MANGLRAIRRIPACVIDQSKAGLAAVNADNGGLCSFSEAGNGEWR